MAGPLVHTTTQPQHPRATHFDLANSIRSLRLAGQLDQAIAVCEDAKRQLPDDHFFAKILADLYFQRGNYEAAFVALADYLERIPPSLKLISDFANRYHRFRRVLPREQLLNYAKLLDSAIDQSTLNPQIAAKAKAIIGTDVPTTDIPPPETPEVTEFIELLSNDRHFDKLATLEKRIEAHGPAQLARILDKVVLNRPRSTQLFRIDLYCVSLYEKFSYYDRALKVLTELLSVRLDPVATRSLFRICRITKNYDKVDELLARKPALIKSNEFNVLYELVYYFEAKNDIDQLQKVLRILDTSFSTNLPVLRTLRNFYIRFGMLEDATRLEPKLLKLYKSRGSARFVTAVVETDAEIASTMRDLHSQVEHQKQLAAISDLTMGISHELGQPITNIRYTIQFYKKLLQKNPGKEGILNVLDSVLEETDRMGALITRLAPLTSGKSVIEQVDVVERINKRVQAEDPRIRESRIKVDVSPRKSIFIQTDPVKFDQLVNNLLLNSIDSLRDRKTPGPYKISIEVVDGANDIRINFSDTGVGIPLSHRNKVFDPFFSTKPPGKGEGLGLFIVWNLLKMQGGRITLDTQYTRGARFVITIPKRAPH